MFDSEPTPLRLEWGEEGLRVIYPLTSEDTDAEMMATGGETRSDTTSKMKTPDRGVDSTTTQRIRRTRRKSKEGVDGALFGSAIILDHRRPVVPGAYQSDMTVLTIRVQDLTEVDNLLRESQKWGTATLVSRQIILHEGPWRDQNMAIAWELYFQAP